MITRQSVKSFVFGEAMSHKIAFYLPSTSNVDKTISQDEKLVWQESAMILLSTMFGGATKIDAIGAWVSDDKGLVLENITIVYAFAKEIDLSEFYQLHDFAEEIKTALSQECVLVEIDGSAYLV